MGNCGFVLQGLECLVWTSHRKNTRTIGQPRRNTRRADRP